MSSNPINALFARLFAPRRAPAAPCPPQKADPTDDWAASVLQSMRCELPLMESIMRVM